MAREGFSVVAVDGSRTAIDKLELRLAKEMLSAKTVVCEADSIPCYDGYFDAVIDIVCLAHNDDTHRISAEIARVLRPGGKLFSVIPKLSCSRAPYEGKGPVHFMNSRDVKGVYQDDFSLNIGWEEVEGPVFLAHWIVDGMRNDRNKPSVRPQDGDVVSG